MAVFQMFSQIIMFNTTAVYNTFYSGIPGSLLNVTMTSADISSQNELMTSEKSIFECLCFAD